jgi:hypothetical protein
MGFLALWTGLAALIVLGGALVLRRYTRYRGVRLVECPQTGKPAAVHVNASKAALTWTHDAKLRLHDCTRWPEHAGCGQDCLTQIESTPFGCRVRELIEVWYRDHPCALCGKEFKHLSWVEHKPALMDAERHSVQWSDIEPETLPEVLETHWPVCWDCHVVETLYRTHAERITERPGRWKEPMTRASKHASNSK